MTTTDDPDDPRDSLPGRLEDVQLHVEGTSYLAGADLTDPGAMDWYARASLYALPDSDIPGAEATPSWHEGKGIALSSSKIPDDDGLVLTILQANGITIDLEQVEDVFDALDSRGQDESDFLPLFSGSRDRFGFTELADEIEDNLEPGGNQVVILDRVRLAPAWRGYGGIGRLLTSRILRWICDDPRLVAVQPFPIDLDSDQRQDDEIFVPAMQQVRRTWASLGFQPFTDKLWIMDPRKSSHHNAVAHLSEQVGLQ